MNITEPEGKEILSFLRRYINSPTPTLKDMKDYIRGISESFIQCSHCNGYGSSFTESSQNCPFCNGSGLLSK